MDMRNNHSETSKDEPELELPSEHAKDAEHHDLSHHPVTKAVLLLSKTKMHKIMHYIPKNWGLGPRYYIEYSLLAKIAGIMFGLHALDEAAKGNPTPGRTALKQTIVEVSTD